MSCEVFTSLVSNSQGDEGGCGVLGWVHKQDDGRADAEWT